MKRVKINWQQILPIFSCIGVVATAVTASRSGCRAQKILEETNYIHHPNPVKDITSQAKIVWKEYILTTAVMALTIGSIIATKKLTKREMAALAMLGTASSKLLNDYKAAIKEVVPERYDDIVRTVVHYRDHDVQIANPPPITLYGIGDTVIDYPFPGEDEILFYDELFDVWFRSSLASVRTAQYHLNRNFQLRGEVSMQEFYEFLGINPPKIDAIHSHYDSFDDIGWGEDFLEGGINWIDISTILCDKEDGEKFFVLSYTFAPEYLYPFELN